VYVHLLANSGYTVFTYDKRGVGDSDGTYVEAASEENIDNLARDLTAAVAFLKSRPEVDRTHIGVMGWSQAGWIIPLAATRSPDIRYTVIISGPGVSLAEESLWSNFTNNGSVAAPPNWESMELQVANASPSGVDSIPSIVKMTVPGLWIYGAKDLSQPTSKSAANLERVRSEGGKDITVAVFADADHSLFINPTGQIADLLVTPGTAPGFFQTIIDWLAEHSMK
jgi:dienelactone hydrolase